VRAVASCALTRWRAISIAFGAPSISLTVASFANSRYVPGAGKPSARMRLAMRSIAAHCSVILLHEHQVQRVEHRTRHVPMEIVRHQIERAGVREKARQTARLCSGIPMSITGGPFGFTRTISFAVLQSPVFCGRLSLDRRSAPTSSLAAPE
jgi:hypothetical protein